MSPCVVEIHHQVAGLLCQSCAARRGGDRLARRI